MIIKSTKSIEELNGIIKTTVIESLVVPLKEKDDNSLFFGTFSNGTYKLYVVPDNPWIKKPRTKIILRIIDKGTNRLVSIDYPKFHMLGLILVAIGAFSIMLGLLFESEKLVILSAPLLVFGLMLNLFRLVGFLFSRSEAIEKIEILKEKITAANST